MRGTKLFVYISAVIIGLALMGGIAVSADTTSPDAEYWVHYVGVGVGRVNVRTGPGEQYDKVTDANGKALQITAQEEVEIIGEKKNTSGMLWYQIRFVRDGVTYEGYSTSSYISKDETRVITPTPIPSATPTPTNTPTPLPSPTDGPAPSQPLMNDDTVTPNSKGKVVIVISLIVATMFILLAVYVAYVIINGRNKSKTQAAMRKVDKLKKLSLETEKNGKKAPQIKKLDDNPAITEEIQPEVYYKKTYDAASVDQASKSSISRESDEKRALRAMIDNLREHDIVYHVIYGEGEVYDNSDVKLLEVRFGNDMRFLKKDQLIARKELRLVEEGENTTPRRRRR